MVRICSIIQRRSCVGGVWDEQVWRAFLHADMPSLWGILVYRELTSKVTSMHPGGEAGSAASF